MRFIRRMLGAALFVFHTLDRATTIRGNGRMTRGRLARTYLKIKAKHFLIKLFPGLRITRERLLGFDISFFDYFMMVCLYETIFVNQDYWFASASPQPLVLDCGSNVGLSVLFMKAHYPECRVVAFEPDPQTFAMLKANIDRNGLADVTLHNKAVYARDGQIDFYYDPEKPGFGLMSTEKNRGPQSSEKVEAVRLSEYVKEEVDFLKLDIEGAEAGVLEELAAAKKLPLVREMVVEYHHHIDGHADDFSRVLRLLEKHGFGYEIAAYPERPFGRGRFQDVMVYAYRR